MRNHIEAVGLPFGGFFSSESNWHIVSVVNLPSSFFSLTACDSEGLISNGHFYHNRTMYNRILKLADSGMLVQITYDTRLYPVNINLEKLSMFMVETKLRNVCKFGRAVANKLMFDDSRRSPFCYNMRSLLKQFGSIQAVQVMEQRGQFCSWGILPSGGLTLSESMLCPAVGHVTDYIGRVECLARAFKCTSCLYAEDVLGRGGLWAGVLKPTNPRL